MSKLNETEDQLWLRIHGWCGWLEDLKTGEVVTHHGDTFKNIAELRKFLYAIPKWPPPSRRNVPKKKAITKGAVWD